MRSILVYADRGPAMPARLETALALAKVSKGHITLLVDTPIGRYISMDPMGGSYVASDAMKQALADDDGQAARLRTQLHDAGMPYDVIRSEDEPVEALAVASRLADVVIVSRANAIAGEIALASRTPVLVLPNDKSLPVPVARACVAWDGGNEAALALRGAIPLLAHCAKVYVLTVREKPGGFPAGDAVRYLTRHSIQAEPHDLTRKGSTEETLAAAVQKIGGELLIMGAYGRSRVREFLFGGVTRYFLEDCPRPALLMAH